MEECSKPIDIRNRNPIMLDQVLVPEWARQDLQEILISDGEISSRVRKMSSDICEHYKKADLYVLTVLKGAVPFFTNLMFNEHVSIPFKYHFIPASSYSQGTVTSGTPEVEFLQKTKEEVKDKDILIVEDIIDTGLTIDSIIKDLTKYKPKSIEVTALLDKPERRKVQGLHIRFTGFIIPDKFVVGYGLDFNGNYRNISHICVLKPEIYIK